MAYLQSNIIGSVLHWYEMEPVVIVSPDGSAVRVRIYTEPEHYILDETYWPDFNNQIILDFKDIVANMLSLSVPRSGADITQSSVYRQFILFLDATNVGLFTVNGYSRESTSRISDADIVRVPKNYKLPLSLVNFAQRTGIKFRFPDGSILEADGLQTTASGIGAVSRLFNIEDYPDVIRHSRFFVELDCGEITLSSPVFEICNGDFEQYLFANRYGGFDSIPMDGVREFVPYLSFESGKRAEGNEQVKSDVEYIYTQNSGFVSNTVMELASELLCSSQIYHLAEDGSFRRIVILDSDINSRSRDSVHSFTFRYKYVDDARPSLLKGRNTVVFSQRAVYGDSTAVFKLTESPMVINHNRGRYPCVTVVDSENHEVTVDVEYLDDNSVCIRWNGELDGSVYIN